MISEIASAGLLAACGSLYAWHRYRNQLAIRRAVDRMNARLAERESIARDLHDTLLQSVQAVILNVQAISLGLPKNAPARAAMEHTVRQASDMLVEGRDRVSELRTVNCAPQALANALQASGSGHPGFRLFSDGQPRALHVIAQDELLAMGRECLLNACRHAGASAVTVLLHFDERTLRLEVHDNGRGIPPQFVAHGRPGHWGLTGIYERGRRIDALVELRSDGGGTHWCIVVPAVIAYCRAYAESERRLADRGAAIHAQRLPGNEAGLFR